MARFMEPTATEEKGWKEWLASRPDNVRAVAERFEPWSLYKLKTTGHRCTIYSLGEADDGSITLTVSITGEFNQTFANRNVFGINPDDLEPCDLPGESEELGSLLGEVNDDNIDILRVVTRPDLWEMGPDGKAKWRGEGNSPD